MFAVGLRSAKFDYAFGLATVRQSALALYPSYSIVLCATKDLCGLPLTEEWGLVNL